MDFRCCMVRDDSIQPHVTFIHSYQEKTMFNQLPKTLQQKILCYLEANNFIAAKQLRDNYLKANI